MDPATHVYFLDWFFTNKGPFSKEADKKDLSIKYNGEVEAGEMGLKRKKSFEILSRDGNTHLGTAVIEKVDKKEFLVITFGKRN
jgi:hypothetical protein